MRSYPGVLNWTQKIPSASLLVSHFALRFQVTHSLSQAPGIETPPLPELELAEAVTPWAARAWARPVERAPMGMAPRGGSSDVRMMGKWDPSK